MTSKHLFFKAMKEDLCHKIWMAALSILGNFLALPVGWMIWRSNMLDYLGGIDGLMQKDARFIVEFQDELIEYFGVYLVVAGGIIAFAGALITGLFGFRYLFHRNMVDTWHSLPVKRDTLYGVNYGSGILIWFVPFLVSLLLMFFQGGSLLGQVGGTGRIWELVADTAFSFLVLVVLYLLVYNVVLVAVMLSGNVLNTLVALGILGFGAVALYGIGIAYFDAYMDTFYSAAVDLDEIMYGSPLFSALALLTARADGGSRGEIWKALLVNTMVAAGLGICAWLLYRNRASEAAEQGSCNRVAATLFRVIGGVTAGMCGWGFFALLLSDSRAYVWGIFGAVLVGVCTFGVMDIIFQMDFKAFFAHKLQMAGTVLLSLLVCFSFCWDWFGYDTRLPAKEEIAEITLNDNYLANHYNYFSVTNNVAAREEMHYRNQDVIYAFLERMTEHEMEETWQDGMLERVNVKVTLNSGESYYRNYWVAKEDKALFWPIVTDEEYLKRAYLISDGDLEQCTGFSIGMGGELRYFEAVTPQFRAIVEAYNQDVLEDPDSVLLGESRLMGEVILQIRYEEENGGGFRTEFYMEVYENMKRTVAALQAAGFERPDAEELGVSAIVLELRCDSDATPQERIALAREYYGVYGQTQEGAWQGTEQGSTDGDTGPDGGSGSVKRSEPQEGEPGEEKIPESQEGDAEGAKTPEAREEEPESAEVTDAEEADEPVMTQNGILADESVIPEAWTTATAGYVYVTVDNPEEIRELFELFCFQGAYMTDSIFGQERIDVDYWTADGRPWSASIRKGILPEKYLLRFGED